MLGLPQRSNLNCHCEKFAASFLYRFLHTLNNKEATKFALFDSPTLQSKFQIILATVSWSEAYLILLDGVNFCIASQYKRYNVFVIGFQNFNDEVIHEPLL